MWPRAEEDCPCGSEIMMYMCNGSSLLRTRGAVCNIPSAVHIT